jgi:hypothetical protein
MQESLYVLQCGLNPSQNMSAWMRGRRKLAVYLEIKMNSLEKRNNVLYNSTFED